MKHLTRTLSSNKEFIGSREVSTISTDLVADVTNELNDQLDGEPFRYSEDQVRLALFKCLMVRIDDFLQNEIYTWFFAHSDMERWLGRPERDLRQEQYEAAGDERYDKICDQAGG